MGLPKNVVASLFLPCQSCLTYTSGYGIINL